MAEYKYLAIRKPDELKGVYSGEETIAKMKQKIHSTEGVSFRNFGKKHEEEALKWAGVNGLADVPQVAINKVVNNGTVKKDTRIPSDFELVIKQYINDKYQTATITLTSGEKIKIQLRDIYYLDKNILYNSRGYGIGSPYDDDENSNNEFYSRVRNSETYNWDDVFDADKFESKSHAIGIIEKTGIKYLNNGVLLNSYNFYIENNREIEYEGYDLYIPFNSILCIKPGGFWRKLNTKITDEKIIRNCKKLF